MNETTTVIFRRWEANLIAFLPDSYDPDTGMMMSYMTVGQHSQANYTDLLAVTKPANPNDPDVQDMIRELESMGYDLKIAKRWRRK